MERSSTTSTRRRASLPVAWLIAAAAPLAASAADVEWAGHIKGRALAQSFPRGSLFRDVAGPAAADLESDLRLNGTLKRDAWTFRAAYQLFGFYGDSVEFTRELETGTGLLPDRLPDDRRRFLDLTSTVTDEDRFALVHRLDRLAATYSTERTVLRIGRQALSWGNGLYFSPLDIVNPFDPATVDTEYKNGDDMLYAQYLRDNGDDVQAAWVVRRDPLTGEVESDQATIAVKYHRISGDEEYEFVLAQNYGAATVAAGGNRSLGGAVWRADLVLGDAAGWTAEFVTNLSYSWVWRGKNVSGAIEYYFNGYGQRAGRYSTEELGRNPELLRRLARGQTYSLGRNNLAAGLTIELTPLCLVTPNLFANLDDHSALLQLVTQYSLGDNLTFLGALNLPVGPDGTEYGGVPAGSRGYFSVDAAVFAQLAWYF